MPGQGRPALAALAYPLRQSSRRLVAARRGGSSLRGPLHWAVPWLQRAVLTELVVEEELLVAQGARGDEHHRLLGRPAGGGWSKVVDGQEGVQGRVLIGHEVQRVAEHVGLHAPRRMVHLVADRKGSASTLGGAGGSVARLRNCVDLCAGAVWAAVEEHAVAPREHVLIAC
eukprot:scaffold130349_cov63-Phaeocystis_antarctica.AAC.5